MTKIDTVGDFQKTPRLLYCGLDPTEVAVA